MTTPRPAPDRKGFSPSARYLFMLLMGLVIGMVATVMVLRAIDEARDKFPAGTMHVMRWHSGQIGANVKANRCAATDVLPHLQALRVLANDLEPAFAGLAAGDARFGEHASRMRGLLDGALASPPLGCEGLGTVASDIGATCKGCHQDFRK